MSKIIDNKRASELYNNSENIKESFINFLLESYDYEEKVKNIILSELNHPNGIGSVIDIEEGFYFACQEWADENLVIPQEIGDKELSSWIDKNRGYIIKNFCDNIFESRRGEVVKKYKKIVMDISKDDSVEDLERAIRNINKNDIYENFSRDRIEEIVDKNL